MWRTGVDGSLPNVPCARHPDQGTLEVGGVADFDLPYAGPTTTYGYLKVVAALTGHGPQTPARPGRLQAACGNERESDAHRRAVPGDVPAETLPRQVAKEPAGETASRQLHCGCNSKECKS